MNISVTGIGITMLGMTTLLLATVGRSLTAAEGDQQPGLIKSEMLFQEAPFKQCHASTLAETSSGLVAAWFGGTREGQADVGIWVSRQEDGRWPSADYVHMEASKHQTRGR